MWICFNNAFVSAVAIKGEPGMLKVRARRRKHLKKLFPDYRIVKTKNTDYRYRVFVDREEFADLVRDKVMRIEYGNFKDSVIDDELHNLYADFWRLHWQYQKAETAQ